MPDRASFSPSAFTSVHGAISGTLNVGNENSPESMTYLVTGAAGFIGSHVVDALLTDGQHVVGLDNLNSYYDPRRKEANIAEVEHGRKTGSFLFYRGDIREATLVESVFELHDISCVIHLAAMAGVGNSIQHPDLYFDVNLSGTQNLLNVIRSEGHMPMNFVFTSTSSVYGATDQIPFVESDPCDRPLVPYSASKRAAELLGYTYHHLYGVNVTVLRLFTVYGPRGRPDMMAYKVLDALNSESEVPFNNGGDMYRDWTYVSDIVSGIVAAAKRPLGYEIVNLGRGEPVRLGDFVQLIEDRVGRKARLRDTPMPVGDIWRTHADVSKAAQLLGYNPKISVAEGVARFVEWYDRAVAGNGATK